MAINGGGRQGGRRIKSGLNVEISTGRPWRTAPRHTYYHRPSHPAVIGITRTRTWGAPCLPGAARQDPRRTWDCSSRRVRARVARPVGENAAHNAIVRTAHNGRRYYK